MALARITDHARRAILNLPPPYWGKPVIATFVWALNREVQVLEDAIWSVLEARLVDTATGENLITLGTMIGEPYLGYAEEDYRALVKARIRINRSSGRANDLIEVLQEVGSESVEVSDLPAPAHAQVVTDIGGLSLPIIRKMASETKAAGVTLDVYTNPTDDAGLRFADAAGLGGVGGWGDAAGNGTPLFGVESI
jgi:hypothetical protein